MGTTKLNIGKIPISKGEYQEGTAYQRLNQVTMLGSTYQSKIDDNTSAPAQMGADGAVENINTDKWLCIAVGNVSAAKKVVYNNETSGLEAGNVQEAIDEVGSKVSDLSNKVTDIDTQSQPTEAFLYAQVTDPYSLGDNQIDNVKKCVYKEGSYDIAQKRYAFYTRDFTITSAGDYYLFVKAALIMDNSNRRIEVSCSGLSVTNEANNHIYANQDPKSIFVGTLALTTKKYSNTTPMYAINMKTETGGAVSGTENVRIEFYGAFLVGKSVVDNSGLTPDDFADKIDYDTMVASFVRVSDLTRLEESVDELSDSLDVVGQRVTDIEGEKIAIESVVDMTLHNLGGNEYTEVYEDAVKGCKYFSAKPNEQTGNVNKFFSYFPVNTGFFLSTGTYYVFMKLNIVSDNSERYATIDTISVLTGEATVDQYPVRILANKPDSYLVSKIVVTSDSALFSKNYLPTFRNICDSRGRILKGETARFETYGCYILSEADVQQFDLEWLKANINYTTPSCEIPLKQYIHKLDAQVSDLEKENRSHKKVMGRAIRFFGHSIWDNDLQLKDYANNPEDEIVGESIRGYQSRILDQFRFIADYSYTQQGGTLGGLTETYVNCMLYTKRNDLAGTPGDIWTLDTSVNDWRMNIPLGTIDDYNNNTGYTTFYGALRYFKDKVVELCGRTAIVIAGCAMRRNVPNTFTILPEDATNNIDLTLLDYAKAIMRVVKLNPDNWYYVDQYRGVIDANNIEEATIDGLHLNNLGYSMAVDKWIPIFNQIYGRLGE